MDISFHTEAKPVFHGWAGVVVARHNDNRHEKIVMTVEQDDGEVRTFPNQGEAIEAAFNVFSRVFVSAIQGIGTDI